VLPPTILFVGFNLILWTKRPILEEHGGDFSGFSLSPAHPELVDIVHQLASPPVARSERVWLTQ
jgi:hypothetical protein